MSDLPTHVVINEEGPREGFQIEPGPIPTARKIELIDALSHTGVAKIQVASFVNPARVPGWADADEVVAGFTRVPGVKYDVLWLNERGFKRALEYDGLTLRGSISTTTSEAFMRNNTNRGFEDNLRVQRNQIGLYQAHGLKVERCSVMTAFGCNFEGDISPQRVVDAVDSMLMLAADCGEDISTISLADSMGWATPRSVKHAVGAVRERWPDKTIALHLHDTRGQGVANAYAGMEMGVSIFDASVAGLGGCPFAKLKGAAGNVCTEDLAFMCEEMGIETGINLERLIAAAQLAQEIVGHPLPGSIMHAGSLGEVRSRVA
jgi:hydroxymethylglutaryl-CoA lyase